MNIKDIKNKIDDHIKYGTVLRIKINENDPEVEIVMLVNNTTAGDGNGCKVLDLSTKEILFDYKNINDFISNTKIVKVVGQFDELFSI